MIAELTRRLEKMTRRERVLVLGAVFAVLVLFWNYLVLVPLETRQARALEQREVLHARIGELQSEQAAVIQRMRSDPNREVRQRIARLDLQLAEQDERIGSRMQRFMRPSDMAGLLRDLLEADSGLHLQRLETLSPEVLIDGAPDAGGPLVYRHGLLLEFHGGYAETLGYLQRVERVAGMLGWDRFELEVGQHPRSRVRIRVHTLSTRREAIGV